MVLDVISQRCSVRVFKDEMPTDEQISEVLEAGRLAPSWLNVQPWHYIVVKNQKIKSLLAKLAPGQPYIEKAPVIIVCCGDTEAWEYEKMKKVLQICLGLNQEKANEVIANPTINPRLIDDNTVLLRTVEQLTYSMAYMTLEAKNQGLGTCVVGALGNELTKSMPALYQVVREELKLPKNMFILSLLLVGIPQENTCKTKVRKNINEIVSYESFGDSSK